MREKNYPSDVSRERFEQMRRLNTSLQFIHLAFLALLLRRA
ncbi:hypothetical protein [Xanthomonas oryzae]|nr:hypothetical protein [Xanthomonas oryzae]